MPSTVIARPEGTVVTVTGIVPATQTAVSVTGEFIVTDEGLAVPL